MRRPPTPYGVHGVFTRALARAAGWTDRQIRHMVESGQWVRVAGVALASRDLVVGLPELGAAALLTWPDAVISHRLAGALWQFPQQPTQRLETATVTVPANLVLRGAASIPIATTFRRRPSGRSSASPSQRGSGLRSTFCRACPGRRLDSSGPGS